MADMILEAGKAIARVIARSGNEAYIAGRKCHVEVHNSSHGRKIKSKKIEIVTTAPNECILKIFPKAEVNDNKYIINFANDNYTIVKIKNKDSFLQTRLFSVDTVLGTYEGEMLDYQFEIDGKKSSCFDDISHDLIRTTQRPKVVFAQNPALILYAFELMAKYGYKIEHDTLEGMKASLKSLQNVSYRDIGMTLRSIMNSKKSYDTLKLMQECGFFNISCNIDGKRAKIFKPFNDIDFSNVKLISKNSDSELEVWSELLNEKNLHEILKFKVFDDDQIDILKWMIKNKNIFEREDYIQAIHDSMIEYKDKYDIHVLKDLFTKIGKRYIAIKGSGANAKVKKFYFWLCARPYFLNQVDLSYEDVKSIVTDEISEKEVINLKEELLSLMTFSKACPRKHELIDILVDKLKEAGHGIIEENVELLKNPEEIKEIKKDERPQCDDDDEDDC